MILVYTCERPFEWSRPVFVTLERVAAETYAQTHGLKVAVAEYDYVPGSHQEVADYSRRYERKE